jgi:hypothetical protein
MAKSIGERDKIAVAMCNMLQKAEIPEYLKENHNVMLSKTSQSVEKLDNTRTILLSS